MTREDLARKICWAKIIWFVGIVNPFIMTPQLFKCGLLWKRRLCLFGCWALSRLYKVDLLYTDFLLGTNLFLLAT